jgi:hypothetical protein
VSLKHKKPRKTGPLFREVRRAATTNWDVIKLATAYWDIATHLETMIDGLTIHNSQRKVDNALITRCVQQARALGRHLQPSNPRAFQTRESTDMLYEQGLSVLRHKTEKFSRQKSRPIDLPDINFY